MARFASWWENDPDNATPSGVAEAARAAGLLVESGDYTIGTFDFGDGGPLADIKVSGSVVDFAGAKWLIYPASSKTGGWQGRPVHHIPGAVSATESIPRQLGRFDDSAESIVAALEESTINC